MSIKEKVWHGFLKRPYALAKIIDQGSGEAVIVLIHGLAANANSWKPILNIVDDRKFRILGYDLLGFGDSPKPKTPKYSVEDHSRSIAAAIHKDAGKKSIIIIGHSMGCIIASRIAARSRLKIKQVILYQPPLLNIDTLDRKDIRARVYKYIANTPSMVLAYGRLTARLSKRLARFRVDAEIWNSFQKSMNNTILKQTTLRELETTTLPTDIVYGSFDFVVSPAEAKKIAAQNQKIKLHKVREMHDISQRSAKFIANLISTEGQKS